MSPLELIGSVSVTRTFLMSERLSPAAAHSLARYMVPHHYMAITHTALEGGDSVAIEEVVGFALRCDQRKVLKLLVARDFIAATLIETDAAAGFEYGASLKPRTPSQATLSVIERVTDLLSSDGSVPACWRRELAAAIVVAGGIDSVAIASSPESEAASIEIAPVLATVIGDQGIRMWAELRSSLARVIETMIDDIVGDPKGGQGSRDRMRGIPMSM